MAMLQRQLKERQKALHDAQDELQRRCSSFEYQLQSACSECTATVEEHVSVTLQGIKKRIDDMQVCSLWLVNAFLLF
jgi:F0F1-type ATP synthase membrane subunit b/b'